MCGNSVMHYKRGSAGQFLLSIDLTTCIRGNGCELNGNPMRMVSERYWEDPNANRTGRGLTVASRRMYHVEEEG